MPAVTSITMRHSSERALRDFASGHLMWFRNAAGDDLCDRVVAAGARDELVELGLIAPPETTGPWVFTTAGQEYADGHGWSC